MKTVLQNSFSFSVSDSSALNISALLCLALGGSAVYMARSIVVLFNDSLAFDDDSLCVLQNVLLRQANDTASVHETRNKIQVYPNPTQDLIYIEFGIAIERPYAIKLFDVTGRLMLSMPLKDQIQSISLTEYINSAGIYFYTIRNEDGNESYHGKVNFIKQ